MADVTNKNDKELEKELTEKRNELRNFRFGVAGSKVRDVKAGKNVRKEIARILTEKNARLREADQKSEDKE